MKKTKMERKKHPIESSWDTLQEEGIIVLDDVTTLPTYDEPIASSILVIGLCLRGSVKLEYDTVPVEFLPHDISVVMPRHTINYLELSPDYQASLIVISEKMFEHMKLNYPVVYQESFFYNMKPQFHLSEPQFQNIRALFQLLGNVCRQGGTRQHEQRRHLLETLLSFLQDYREANGITTHRPSPHEQLYARFVEAISLNYTQSREVRFYANLFCLSPKHFSTIIKQLTGINASDWISSYVVTQAKTLLLYNMQLSIQQIALRLGFPDQASFARYFKTQAGLSPREFRSKRRQ